MDIQRKIKELLEAGMLYGENTPEEKLTWLIGELKILSRVELPVKPANGVKISEEEESDSIILEKNGLRYECYFDKKYHCIFVGEPQAGSLINIGTPENPTGTLKVEFYPMF